MHRTLERQIKKFLPGVSTAAEEWKKFFQSIDETYRHFDDDRKLISRSLELSSTELVEVNEKIAREKARNEIILESIGDALVVIDAKGAIALINKSAENLLNCASTQAQGKAFLDCVESLADENGLPLEAEKHPINLALTTGYKTSTACQLTRKDKSRFIASILAAPFSINKEIAGVACIIRDITKEKEIDRAKSEFVSLASHQLRTPLSTIGWYTEMLLAGDAGSVNEEQKGYLEEIYHGNKRMVDLVNALLNVSRIELGTFMLTPEPVNVVEVAKSVLKEVHPNIIRNGLNLREVYEDNLPVIQADPKLTRIILQNLITNAVKYTPSEGQITVSVSSVLGEAVKHGNAKEQYVLISVKDTGYGIPKAQKDKIFTKLFRADNIREKETDGTGLGLYLVKSILDACGGEVWFESEEDKGSKFYVIIPLSGMRAKAGTKILT